MTTEFLALSITIIIFLIGIIIASRQNNLLKKEEAEKEEEELGYCESCNVRKANQLSSGGDFCYECYKELPTYLIDKQEHRWETKLN